MFATVNLSALQAAAGTNQWMAIFPELMLGLLAVLLLGLELVLPKAPRALIPAVAILGLGARTAQELARGQLEQVLIKGKNGYVLLTHAGGDAVLAVMTKASAKLGLIFLDVKRAAEAVAKII